MSVSFRTTPRNCRMRVYDGYSEGVLSEGRTRPAVASLLLTRSHHQVVQSKFERPVNKFLKADTLEHLL